VIYPFPPHQWLCDKQKAKYKQSSYRRALPGETGVKLWWLLPPPVAALGIIGQVASRLSNYILECEVRRQRIGLL
jgi:hypothetical protein